MSNGIEYMIEADVETIVNCCKNSMSVLINGLVNIGGIYVNPSNICILLFTLFKSNWVLLNKTSVQWLKK